MSSIGQQAIDSSGKPLNVGDGVTVPVIVTSVSGSGTTATVDANTLYSSTSISVEGSDLGASVVDAQSAQAPNQSVTPQALTLTGRPVQANDQATVIGTITAITAVNGTYGPQAQVTREQLQASPCTEPIATLQRRRCERRKMKNVYICTKRRLD
jgi:hypothetical protein